ncbi:hypothetical protein E4U13_001194 [Claviceps humidiphila]|uniref:Uncharacterized protein n=1 Tax=Claviceps humidiphila TaxID=1294629 RepID=A0A9P7Q3T9_9HYPO|nr:hypothetical protein E4U13_001194 [Claviceps humidiphila]
MSDTRIERHYSYECKASSQERPYVSRPSRSQQLRNPKLVPKLTNDTPNPVEKKKGLADEILAKQEAQRTRLQELEGGDESDVAPSPNRRRSVSSESVSTVSTALSRRPRSPRSSRPLAAPKSQPRRRSPSYDHVQRDVSPRRSISRSLTPPVRRRRSPSRDSLSPRRSLSPEPGKRRRSPSYDDVGRNVSPRRSISRSLSPAVRRSRMRSRDSLSPRGDSRERHYRNRAEDRRGSGLRGHRAEDIEVVEVVEVVAEVEEVEEVAHRTTVAVEEIRALKHHGSEV